jgi:ferredoxin
MLMRLNWFLPFLRKSKKGPARKAPGLVVRLATRLVPGRWLSDTVEGRPGWVRRLLKRLGPTWSSSPFRRVVQSACFLLFLVLFFYVCWPYSARPVRVSHNWTPVSVDPETGVVTVTAEQQTGSTWATGARVYIAEPDADAEHLGRFTVTRVVGHELTLKPVKLLTAAQLEKLSFSPGPWTLRETAPGAWPSHYADDLARKQTIEAESFLIIDPLLSISTALAAKAWVWSLVWAGVILVICVVIPRGFCGYVCPLGTLIDLFDWAVGRRVTRFRVADDGWWVHVKYYVLMGTLIAAMFGVLVSGFVAAIPVVTRGFLFLFKPLHDGATRGWHNVPPINAGHVVSIVLFFAVLAMGLWKPRFWCKYVCPSGAVFSLGNLLRVSERKVESSCINCNKCVEVCPFDAIKPDFTTRTTDCTLCQTCGGVCPTDAIKFVDRWDHVELKINGEPPTGETRLGRRGFLAAGMGLVSAVTGGAAATLGVKALGANLDAPDSFHPVRPPGSVPEPQFLQMCIRCGECFKACPNDVLQPLGFKQGLEGLWTPVVHADWAGCETSCNNCGQVCPTGAIRALPLPEKKAARMGLAAVNPTTCLPFAGREACQLCVDECNAAGYHAIEFVRVGTRTDEEGRPIEGSGYVAPVVRPDRCVGCGLCQTRCFAINVREKGLLRESAIIIEAGDGKEDRLMHGSYVQLRRIEAEKRREVQRQRSQQAGGADSYLPDLHD